MNIIGNNDGSITISNEPIGQNNLNIIPSTPSTPIKEPGSKLNDMVNNQINDISIMEKSLGGTDGGTQQVINKFKNLGIQGTGI